MTITIESRGRRHYLLGNTYPIKDAIKAAGCKFDPEVRAWYTGKLERAQELVGKVADGSVQATASYAKLADGSWGIRVPGTVEVGASVTVVTKSGDRKTETVLSVLSTDDRGSLCSVAQRARRVSSGSSRYSLGRRTGCYCGSREGGSQDSDCWTCKHDAE